MIVVVAGVTETTDEMIGVGVGTTAVTVEDTGMIVAVGEMTDVTIETVMTVEDAMIVEVVTTIDEMAAADMVAVEDTTETKDLFGNSSNRYCFRIVL